VEQQLKKIGATKGDRDQVGRGEIRRRPPAAPGGAIPSPCSNTASCSLASARRDAPAPLQDLARILFRARPPRARGRAHSPPDACPRATATERQSRPAALAATATCRASGGGSTRWQPSGSRGVYLGSSPVVDVSVPLHPQTVSCC